MTAPLDDSVNKFGPGVLKIGSTGSEIDASCMVNNLTITASPNRGDSKVMLCGTTKPGSVTYDYEMGGNLDLDLELGEDSLFALSQAEPGSEQPFVFTPNEEGGTTAEGTLILDPLDFGSSDGFGAIMASDVAWALKGAPTYTYGGGTPPAVATGATAGTPGSFTPGGSTVPANLAALSTVTASPTTAWTTGQYVATADATHQHWSGTAWATGDAA
jgi:hypothetical protein